MEPILKFCMTPEVSAWMWSGELKIASMSLWFGFARSQAVALLTGAIAFALENNGRAIDLEKIHGRIQFVSAFPDFKVQIVDAFEDLRVEKVTAFADAPGKWQIVNANPDYKIQIVNSLADFKVKFVKSFPGANGRKNQEEK